MKKVWLPVLALSLILVLFSGCGTADDNGSGSKTGAASTASEGKTGDDITFNNVIVSTTSGITTVYGEVSNTTSKARSFTLKVSFYDKDSKLLGAAVGAVNNINGGATKIFSAIASGDYSGAANYKVQVDTTVKTENNKPEVVEFSNTVANKAANMTTISGEAKNIDTATHSFTLDVGAYDSAGKLIGVATGAVNDLAAGDTKTFSAIAAGDLSAAATYKVFVSTLVK